jgi:hypothetical protein
MDAFESRLASVATKAIEEMIQSRSSAVLNGSAQNFDHHRYDIGYLQGLSAGLGAIEDARKLMYAGERV